VCGPIALIVIGPLGTILGNGFAVFCDIMNQWGWIAVGLNAAIFPFLVLTGMHNALIPLMIQMFMTQGFDSVLIPPALSPTSPRVPPPRPSQFAPSRPR
jgi:PTS system beta-glucosides-specific IIC component